MQKYSLLSIDVFRIYQFTVSNTQAEFVRKSSSVA
jgi:hypothetical protein